MQPRCSALLDRQRRRPFAAEAGTQRTATCRCDPCIRDAAAEDLAGDLFSVYPFCSGKCFNRTHEFSWQRPLNLLLFSSRRRGCHQRRQLVRAFEPMGLVLFVMAVATQGWQCLAGGE